MIEIRKEDQCLGTVSADRLRSIEHDHLTLYLIPELKLQRRFFFLAAGGQPLTSLLDHVSVVGEEEITDLQCFYGIVDRTRGGVKFTSIGLLKAVPPLPSSQICERSSDLWNVLVENS